MGREPERGRGGVDWWVGYRIQPGKYLGKGISREAAKERQLTGDGRWEAGE